MISILYQTNKYHTYSMDMKQLVYVTHDMEKIKELFKNNLINVKKRRKYSDESDDNGDIASYFKIVNFVKDKEISSYYVDMEKKIIIDEKDKVIFDFSPCEDSDKKVMLINKKVELLKECKDISWKKEIPFYENNYFHIFVDIESSNNLQEDVDYLEVIKEELNKYEDKKKK